MKKSKIVKVLVAIGVTVCLLLAITPPATAATAMGVLDGFFGRCDASVYVSDSLIGSPGKIEAWGGYSCPQSFKFIGEVKLVLKNGNAVVQETQKAVNQATNDVNITVTNSPGVQNWHADMWIFRPGFDRWIISTGMVSS
jgi:hypothetical protein